MLPEISCLKWTDLLPLELGMVYEKAGYHKYRMSRFEEYSLYRENEGFLSSRQLITFTDLDGRLLALKPDVTLSIAKNARPAAGECARYYYSESVFRPSLESRAFREISQMGLECIGQVQEKDMVQALELAAQSLAALEQKSVLVLGHMGFVAGLLDAAGFAPGDRGPVLECLRDKRAHQLDRLCNPDQARLLRQLLALNGSPDQVLPAMEAMVQKQAMAEAAAELAALCRQLQLPALVTLTLDLSLVQEIDYYNGLVFRGYRTGLPAPVLQGGRYDPLASRFSPGARAVGFALYLDQLERGSASQSSAQSMLSIALPKGRLGEKVYTLLQQCGFGCEEDFSKTRKLIVENAQAGVRFFWVKPSDVPIYVEHGAADIGIVGKDTLDESGADVYELLDTGLGRCDMCVAGFPGFEEDTGSVLRVATKFPQIAKSHYAARGRDIDIIKLNGSIELAPLVGLADVIVDIVETGTTLRENGLAVLERFLPISARLIANKAAYQFKGQRIDQLLQKLNEVNKQ